MSTNKPPGDPGTLKPQNKGVKRPARETDGNITVSSVSLGCAPNDEIQEIRIDDLPSAALNSPIKELVPEFLDEFYSSLDKDCHRRFSTVIHSILFATTNVFEQKIYNFFNNFKAEDEEVVHHLKKMMPENLWYKECPSVTNKAIEAYLSKNKGSKHNIDEDKHKAEAAGPLTGEVQEQYYDKFLHKLHSLAKEGEKTAGIVLSVHIAYHKSTSSNISGLSIDFFCSKQISDYKKTRDHTDSAMSFAAYLQEEMDAPIVGQPPEPAIVPDQKDHNCPIIPAIDSNICVPLAHRLVRSAITAYWCTYFGLLLSNCADTVADDAGGISPVLWAEIKDSIKSEDYKWIEKEQLPDASKALFKEPGQLKLSECLEWLVHLSKRQNGAPATERFQFQQVYASTSPPPSWSCALQPSPQIQRGKHQVYLLHYEGCINQSQVAAGIPYHKSTWEWLAHLDGEGSLSQHWHGLPSCLLQEVCEPLIGNWEMDVIKEVFCVCDDEVLNKVERLVQLVNKAKKYVPAMTPSGLWSEINSEVRPLPLLFPQTSPLNSNSIQYLLTFWMWKEYYQLATKTRDEGTMDFLEGWLKDSLTKGVTQHEQSCTFIGGPCGVVWVVRGLAKTLANIGACVGKIIPPIPAPESYELDRIGLPHWNRALKWESAAERLSPPEASQDNVSHTIDDDPDLQLHLPKQAASTENNVAAGKEAPTPQRRQQPDRLKKPRVVKSNHLVSACVTSEEEEASESEGSRGSDNFDPDVADEEEDEDDLEDDNESKEEIPMEASQKSTQAKAAKSTKRPRKHQWKSLTGNPAVSDDIEDQSVDLGALSSHSLPNIDYSAWKNVFGAFATPKIFPLLTLKLVPMVKHLKSMLVMSKGLLVHWANGAESYRDPYCMTTLNKARLVARQSNHSKPMKACVWVILLQQSVWSNAHQSWPMVCEYHQIMLNGFCEIAMTMDCASRLKKEHASSKPGPEYSLFLSHQGVLLAQMYTIRFILKELKHLEAISTKWANQLQDAWEHDFTQWEDLKLISLVKSMVEWYEAEPTTSWYTFGNPGASCMVEEAIAAISAGNPPKDLQVDQPTPNLSQADSLSALPTDGILDNSSANNPTSLSRGPPPQADSCTDDSSVEDHTQQCESSPGQQDKLAWALGEEPSSTVDTSTATPPDVGGARDNSDIVAELSSGKGIGKGRSGGWGGQGGCGILCKQSGTTTCTDASTTEGSETGQSYFLLESMSGSSVCRSGCERHPSAQAKGL
ncbi:hypothetical protein CTheo_6419 [Ceratobasidium theobromae]|uniref:Uncharacterized protein n=1 Tax=Ceratobasidium theobromae TaxID=1582974 RepID=A0A5N5QEF3_9AGAM|nr:hypothetical protein CTheo_6419 [Ceratobasidium theobromae]